jgi:maintenance of morphology protein 1
LSKGGEEGARQKIERWLNPNGGLSWIVSLLMVRWKSTNDQDPIQVTALSLGSAYPLLSNARIRPSDGQGHIVSCFAQELRTKLIDQRAEIDIDYSDSTSLSLSTSLLINFPRPRFAVLPVSLGVQLASIGGTVS